MGHPIDWNRPPQRKPEDVLIQMHLPPHHLLAILILFLGWITFRVQKNSTCVLVFLFVWFVSRNSFDFFSTNLPTFWWHVSSRWQVSRWVTWVFRQRQEGGKVHRQRCGLLQAGRLGNVGPEGRMLWRFFGQRWNAVRSDILSPSSWSQKWYFEWIATSVQLTIFRGKFLFFNFRSEERPIVSWQESILRIWFLVSRRWTSKNAPFPPVQGRWFNAPVATGFA